MAEAPADLAIVALDAHGCGVVEGGTTLPGALPGERVRVRSAGRRAELIEVLNQSPERAMPYCPWFGRCGGCAAQHMSDPLYRDWKRGLVVEALRRAGVEARVGPLVDAHGAGRRRATFHARFPHGLPDEVGFMRARSHDIVSIDACPLFAPPMAGAVESARALAHDLRGLMKPLDIGVTATSEGLDVDLRGSGPLDLAETRKLIRTADALDLARLSNHCAVVVERRPPRVAFGEALVTLPPGGFLQATEAGETWLAAFADELAAFDGVLFDPPRAGAEAQAREFAASALKLVVAISCNAATFARDARILVDGGFGIETVTPLDQFRSSPHVEIAAVFRRKSAKPRARRLLG